MYILYCTVSIPLTLAPPTEALPRPQRNTKKNSIINSIKANKSTENASSPGGCTAGTQGTGRGWEGWEQGKGKGSPMYVHTAYYLVCEVRIAVVALPMRYIAGSPTLLITT
ncbi:hypothetical protein M426DRAFT_126112 [Hypoxylon sp. CI-4A]|nr:hypothetical protein M426DRAFT_126112 [Hypoxylon sp. CI-4A]